jgi:NADPH-dependent 7-cyano-7-deazaguanine reductase QueF
MLKTITNSNPQQLTALALRTSVQGLCPHSTEPQEGSTLTVHYTAGAQLLDIRAVLAWLAALPHEAVDLETLVQRLAADAAAALDTSVTVEGDFILRDGLTLQCTSSIAPAKTQPSQP